MAPWIKEIFEEVCIFAGRGQGVLGNYDSENFFDETYRGEEGQGKHI